MDLLLFTARLLLAGVFAVAGFAKLFDLAGSRKSIVDFGMPQALAPLFGVLLPAVELACAAALLPTFSAWWGAVGVFGLLLLFLAAMAFSIARGRRPDCHCFGQLHSAPIGWKTFARNAVLLAVAGFVLWQGPHQPAFQIATWMGGLTELEGFVLVVSLICAAAAVTALSLFFKVLAKYGQLLVRLEAVEARTGMIQAPPVPPAGLPVDTPAPPFRLSELDRGTVSLASLTAETSSLVLVFSEPGCGACETLLPDIARWQSEYAKRLPIVLISSGSLQENRAKREKYGLRSVLMQKDREVAQAFKVDATPSAVLVTNGRIAQELALGPDAIRGMVARIVLPQLSKGDTVPNLSLPNLDGGALDLATLKGHRSLLLFWNPSCGYCQQMLPELKKWEKTPLSDAPRLVVLSSGSVEENRQQGFLAPVLLDHSLSAMHVFGTGGTPSAVMLDEQGRVASGVEVGADAVLALAGVVRVAAR